MSVEYFPYTYSPESSISGQFPSPPNKFPPAVKTNHIPDPNRPTSIVDRRGWWLWKGECATLCEKGDEIVQEGKCPGNISLVEKGNYVPRNVRIPWYTPDCLSQIPRPLPIFTARCNA